MAVHLLALAAALALVATASPAIANQLILGFSSGGALAECPAAPCYNGTPFISHYDWITDDNTVDDAVSGGTDYDTTLANGAAINQTCPSSFGQKCIDLADTANDDKATTSIGVYDDHGTMGVVGDAYTFCTWFYPDSEDVDNQLIWEQANGSNAGWEIKYEKTGNKCRFRARVGSNWKTSTGATNSCTNGTWVHICGVIHRDGSGLRSLLYINGVLADNTSSSATTYTRPTSTVSAFGDPGASKTKPGFLASGSVALAVFPTDDEICIIANCGPFNEFSCTCSGSNYAAATGKNLGCMSGIAGGLCAKRDIGTQ